MTLRQMAALVARSVRRRPRQLLLVALCGVVSAATGATLGGFVTRARGRLARELRVSEPNLIIRSQVAGPRVLGDAAVAAVQALPGVEAAVLGAEPERIEARVDPAQLDSVRALVEQTVAGSEAVVVRRISVTEARLVRRVMMLLAGTTVLVVLLAGAAAASATLAVLAERRGEVGLLLALGMSPGAALRLLGLELLLVSGAGLAIGVVTGELLAARLVDRLLGASGGGAALASPLTGALTTTLTITLAVCAALVVLAAALVAAGRRLARLDPARLLVLD